MKSSIELTTALGATIESGFKVGEDKKVTVGDIVHLVDDFTLWETAVQDLTLAKDLRESENKDVEAALQAFSDQLQSPSEELAYDLKNILGGILSGYRLGVRKGREEAIAELAATGSIS